MQKKSTLILTLAVALSHSLTAFPGGNYYKTTPARSILSVGDTIFPNEKSIYTLKNVSANPDKGFYDVRQIRDTTISKTGLDTQKLIDYYLKGGEIAQRDYHYLATILKLPLVTRQLLYKEDPFAFKYKPTTDLNPTVTNPMKEHKLFMPELELTRTALERMQVQNPSLFAIPASELEKYRVVMNKIDVSADKISLGKIEDANILGKMNPLGNPENKKLKWIPSFESSIQFSQNYVSSNWYKGGSSNLNLFMRNYFAMLYMYNRVKWNSLIESKLSVYNAANDTIHKRRVGDDLLRLRSTFGYKAFSNWYYSIDAEFRTQVFNGYKENSKQLQASFLSPMATDIGLGMSYEYEYKSKTVYGRKFKFGMNIAPFAYTFKTSLRDDIDLARHGLSKEKRTYSEFGSSLKAQMQWDFDMDISWQSRLYFLTSYSNVQAEWENIVNFSFTRFFSTRLYVNLRYDDAVPPSKEWGKYFQLNELISLGFNFKI
ncbi:DUF3078 domain-containing protein [Porphyromonas pogonae]|uniref:DUF3078 domain-containing protein n=1 Tax=Porphyromonas pogonae TaxID=867595 RepID=UPI002E7628B2|nr:DUF3078 domain-containing protein [Porphyromonas pogonae]